MKLTTRARYGLRMLADIAAHPAPVTLSMVAERQGISIQYLRQLALSLSRNGILVSAKGKNGGYQLSRSAHAITLYEILSALEGDICITPEKNTDENPYEMCLRVYLYEVVDRKLSELLSGKTLADLLLNSKNFFQI